MLHRIVSLALLLVASVLLGVTPQADASWTATATGTAGQKAATMPVGNTPSVVPEGLLSRSFTLTWPTAWLHPGRPATGYLIARQSSLLGGGLISDGTCVGIGVLGLTRPVFVPAAPGAATQSCTDVSLVSLGTVQYTVTPVYEHWIGTPSSWSVSTG